MYCTFTSKVPEKLTELAVNNILHRIWFNSNGYSFTNSSYATVSNEDVQTHVAVLVEYEPKPKKDEV